MKRGDIYITLGLLALAGLLLLVRLSPGKPTVYVNGEMAWEDVTVNDVEIGIMGKGAIIVSSPCKDQLCVHTGWLMHPGDVAVCLPQRVIVEIRGAGKKVDGVAY